ncbi:hypothetical protein QFZ22_000017 [Streptomyces canus]|uniref:Uncharacterized protein n=1 Tax=Streptomyces canus TaxID=58343 RepID=A0AAW8F2F0_9ACTN|nr:hypothetical protein [Streptomyces canus]
MAFGSASMPSSSAIRVRSRPICPSSMSWSWMSAMSRQYVTPSMPCPQPKGVCLVNSIVQPDGVAGEWRARVAAVRRELIEHGPPRSPDGAPDFATVTLPERDCDQVRDLLVDERVGTVVETAVPVAANRRHRAAAQSRTSRRTSLSSSLLAALLGAAGMSGRQAVADHSRQSRCGGERDRADALPGSGAELAAQRAPRAIFSLGARHVWQRSETREAHATARSERRPHLVSGVGSG